MGSSSKDRAMKAMAAVSEMGFPRPKTKLVLKQLLRTCENNWDHIEAENYRLLVEAILESEEPEVEDPVAKKNSDNSLDQSLHSKRKERLPPEEPGPHMKRLREKEEEARLSTPVESSGMPSRNFSSAKNLALQSNPGGQSRSPLKREPMSPSPDTSRRGQGTVGPLALYPVRQEKRAAVIAQRPVSVSGLQIEPCLDSMLGATPNVDNNEEIIGDRAPFEVPLAIIHTSGSGPTIKQGPPSNNPEKHCQRNFPSVNSSKSGSNASASSSNATEIVSSATEEGKILLCYNVVGCPNFRVSSLESVMKKVEDKCLRSYKIFDPNFSLLNIMKDFCNTLLETGTKSVDNKQEDHVKTAQTLDPLKLPNIEKLSDGLLPHSASSPGLRLHQDSESMALDGLNYVSQLQLVSKGTSDTGKKEMKTHIPEPSGSLVLFHQHEPALGDVRPVHDIHDITKGEERVRIPVVNDVGNEQYPPHFSYIPHNIVYQNAHVNFSLARIGDENCCSDCFGNCLSARIPCACARETSGEYAYTHDGLLKKEFLNDCISMKHEPKKHHLFYCKDCPIERSKNEVKPDPCKGHLIRKFIKECWSKCGCTKQCGNRVVQRGITCNLQVFFTQKGKGWGLQALDDLPRGSFICEYIGEVLTNMELYDRMIESTGNKKHTYPVLLDADWGSEGVLKDEEALCLDATFYGNVARFINHRCGDANLVEVPVEVETPDHHYYHLAFFTARKVEAFEELTWDYGIDFDDENHPIKAFQCCCGSTLCRDRKSRNRSKYGALVLR